MIKYQFIPGQNFLSGLLKNTMRFLFSILIMLCLNLSSRSQTQSMLFEKSWGVPNNQGIYFADELPNGDYFLAGIKRDISLILHYVCRMSPNGTIIWEKDWGYMNSGIADLHKYGNDYIVLGCGDSPSGGGISDIEVTRIDADGNIIYTKYFDYNYQDYAVDMCDTYDGNFIISTCVGSLGSHIPAFYKIDPDGNLIWRRILAGYTNYVPSYIRQTPDSGFIVTGVSPYYSYYAKYNSNGILQWIHDTIPNRASALHVNQDGTFSIYYRTDYITSSVPPQHIYGSLRNYDSSGIYTSSHEYPIDLIYVFDHPTDTLFSGISTSTNYWYEMNLAGDFTFKAGLQETGRETKSIFEYIPTSDGGYLAIGSYTWDYQNSPFTFYIAKFSKDGRYNADEFSESVNVYPNPSSDGNINLTFDMKTDENVDVRIFSTEGKLIYSNIIFCPANSYTELPVRLDYTSTEAGMYILEARTKEAVIRKKLMVMRKD